MCIVTEHEIRHHLTGTASPLESLQFLKLEFVPRVIQRLNSDSMRRQIALYGGDRVPENERNLTDVRNRVSILIEYKFAWISNEMLRDHGIKDLFWAYVVANRFPDLEVRSDQGSLGIRVEVKCIQSVAEEKSANFDALMKDLNPNCDYVAVFLWEWFFDTVDTNWDRAPKILRAFIFHAESLARLRDYNWLMTPPKDLGSGFQGFDLRYAVNCKKGEYKLEEGNFGKLLRIWRSNIKYRLTTTPLLRESIKSYLKFEDYAIWSGFESLATRIFDQFDEGETDVIVYKSEKRVGFKRAALGLVLRRRYEGVVNLRILMSQSGIRKVIVMGDKYTWTEYKETGGGLIRLKNGKKPKQLVEYLLLNPLPIFQEIDGLLTFSE